MDRRRIALFLAGLTLVAVGAAADAAGSAGGSTEDLGLWQRFLLWRAARTEVTDTYLLAVQGPGYAALQDTRMTPLVYRAVGGALSFEDRTYRPREIVVARILAQYSHVISDGALEGRFTYSNPRGSGSVAYLRRLGAIAVGGELDLTLNWRLLSPMGNSMLNYDVIASVGPAARWEGDARLFGRPVRRHIAVHVPLVAHVTRSPAYNLSYVSQKSFWAAPWTFYRLRASAGIDRLLRHSDENRIAVTYHYDFYGLREDPHAVVLGLHTITIGYALKVR